jgi:hypothetical protein
MTQEGGSCCRPAWANRETLPENSLKQKRAQKGQCLPSKCRALSSNPDTAKKTITKNDKRTDPVGFHWPGPISRDPSRTVGGAEGGDMPVTGPRAPALPDRMHSRTHTSKPYTRRSEDGRFSALCILPNLPKKKKTQTTHHHCPNQITTVLA